MNIQKLEAHHYEAVKKIYLQGVATGYATFETEAPLWEEWDKNHLKYCRLVAVENGEVIGWAALSPVSGRRVYTGVAEVSIYIGQDYRGRGIGKELLRKLIEASEQNNLWTLQAGIFRENRTSLHLHQDAGFREVGYREKIGKLNGIWHDTILLERRSKLVGLKYKYP